MKKLIILIFLISGLTMHLYAQKGITAQFIRNVDFAASINSESDFERSSGNGFSLGYMYYKNDRQFKQLKFSYISSSADRLEREVYGNSGPMTHLTYQNHYNTFIFSYEKYTMWGKGEMDDANIWYGYGAWDLIYDIRSYDITSSDPDRNVKYSETQENSPRLSPLDVGFRLGLGYQHNFSHKMGAFIDFNLGFRIINFGYTANTNIGVRMNLK